MTSSKEEGSPGDYDPQITPNSRPKRRTAKVDYTEKKMEYEFEIPNAHLQQVGTERSKQKKGSSGTPETDGSNGTSLEKPSKRKYVRKNGSGSNTRADTPMTNGDEEGGFPMNYQPEVKNFKFSHMLDLSGAVVKDGIELILSNGEKLTKNENIYLICEPPGEPYYIGRIMGFVKKHQNNQHENGHKDDDVKVKTRHGKSVIEPADGYKFKINWYYRSRDISKHSTDSRLLYASMHSDTCPLQSFRGRCVVKHKEEIDDFETFKTIPNQFWFDKLFDRYMIRFYDVLPTSQLTSLPKNYHSALMKRFPYIFVEQGKSKDMLQSPKSCSKCHQWCSHSDSIECCECHEMYHMLCLDPPLYKKPARGFAWSCIKCTKKLEGMKLLPNTDISKEEEISPSKTQVTPLEKKLPSYEELAIIFLRKDSDLDLIERRNQEEWVYRYLGMHAKLEDALDLQDRPYPRAASRLGSKHQLTGVVFDWFDHTVQYYDSSELNEEYQKTSTPVGRKKKVDGRKQKGKMTSEEPEESYKPLELPEEYKETDPSEFPPWLQERPKGYIERGSDDTATLLWKMPTETEKVANIDGYIKEAEPIAVALGLLPNTPNFVDQILKNLLNCNYDFTKAQEMNKLLTKESLKEPSFSKEEIERFEDGVRQFGSELYPVSQLVKTQPVTMVVRFYYLWKKTKNGHLIWDNFEGRKKTRNKQHQEDNAADDLGNSADDSSYDQTKATKRNFQCKHCQTLESIQWFRSPGAQQVADSTNGDDSVLALCMRCARLWRRYAVIWEEPNEVLRKTGQKGGYGWKKKLEAELMADADLILKAKSEYVAANADVSKKRKQSSVEPVAQVAVEQQQPQQPQQQIKKVKSEARTSLPPTPEKKPTVDKKGTKEKRPYNKKAFEAKKEEKPEILVSNILVDLPSSNLKQAIVERYYHSTSGIYNSRLKFHEFPNQRSPLISQSSSKLIKPITNSKKCAVCLDNNDPNTSLFCYGCGANIHPLCYGVDSEDVKNPFGSYKWYCDPCSNTLNPIVSNNHKCCLCGMHNDDEIVKAGLKRTTDGKWAHIICALFNPHVKFTDTGSLQPVYGVQNAIAAKFKEGKAIRKCDVCEDVVTLREAQQPSSTHRVGFKVSVEPKPDSKCVKVGNNFGRLFPIVICGKHDFTALDFNFISLTTEVKRYKQSNVATALQLYIEDFKRPVSNGLTGVQGRYAEFQDAIKILSNHSNGKPGTNGLSSVVDSDKKCGHCGAFKTLKWINTPYGVSCYKCHLLREEDIEMKDASDVNEGIGDRLHEKIVEVSNGALYGSHYGIKDPEDHVAKPLAADEPEYYEFKPTPQSQQVPQQLPFKNGSVSEYRYFPPPPTEDESPPPQLQPQPTVITSATDFVPTPTSSSEPTALAVTVKKEEHHYNNVKHSIQSIMNNDEVEEKKKQQEKPKTPATKEYEIKKMSIGNILG